MTFRSKNELKLTTTVDDDMNHEKKGFNSLESGIECELSDDVGA